MEFEDLGGRCSVRTCRQHDFLPLTCHECKRQFCSEHYKSHDACPHGSAHLHHAPLVCGECNEVIQVLRADASASEKAKAKASHVCTTKRARTSTCAFKGCRTRPLVPVQCNRCKLNFCLQHRVEGSHQCTGPRVAENAAFRRAAKALERSREPLPATIPNGYTNSPVNPKGDARIPGDQRIYVEVEYRGSLTHWYFHRNWSVAKALDQIEPSRRLCMVANEECLQPLQKMGEVQQHSRVTVADAESSGKCGAKAQTGVPEALPASAQTSS